MSKIMAKGDWWFKFEWKEWRGDPALRRCSFETQGMWINCLCVMHESESAMLSGSADELARLLGCFPEELMRCAVELKNTNTADVIIGNGTVSILSRRYQRELTSKERNRLQVQKSRSKANVSGVSEDRVRVKSKKEKRSVSSKTPTLKKTEVSQEAWLAELKQDTLYSHIDVDREFAKAMRWIDTQKGKRRFTRTFFTGWLNRIEVPLHATPPKPDGVDYNEMHRQELLADLARRNNGR